jgi:hypothetical protein
MSETTENVTVNPGTASSDEESEDIVSTSLQNGGSAEDSAYGEIGSSTGTPHPGA